MKKIHSLPQSRRIDTEQVKKATLKLNEISCGAQLVYVTYSSHQDAVSLGQDMIETELNPQKCI